MLRTHGLPQARPSPAVGVTLQQGSKDTPTGHILVVVQLLLVPRSVRLGSASALTLLLNIVLGVRLLALGLTFAGCVHSLVQGTSPASCPSSAGAVGVRRRRPIGSFPTCPRFRKVSGQVDGVLSMVM